MSKRKKYTHIFFDLDNTLWDFKRNSSLAMEMTFNSFSLEKQRVSFFTFFETYSKHNNQLWTDYRSRLIPKKELIWKRFQNTFDDLSITGINPEEMNSCYLNEMPKQTILNQGAQEILNYLKNKNYRLFIITNGFKEVQFKKLESSNLLSFFEKIFISEVIKAPKPAKEIFDMAVKSSNARKTKSLMVGDDWDVDIMGAVNAGIDAVHYNPENSSDAAEELKQGSPKIITISNLVEIKSVL